MDELNCFPEDIDQNIQVMLVNFGEQESIFCLPILKKIRENGISSELYPSSSKLKKQMIYANKKNVEFVVMIGEDEMSSGRILVRNMEDGTQKDMTINEFISKIK